MLAFALILSLAAPSLAADPSPPPKLECPDLAASLICSLAESGFNYNDGCNDVVCSGEGVASTTLVACRPPQNAEQRRQCDALARAVWSGLGPYTCPNVNADAVCASRPVGFAFSDGCNRVRCGRGGAPISTRMACQIVDPEGPYCRFTATAISEAPGPNEPRTGAVDEAQFECPALHYSKVCAEYLPGFQYSDGCRQIKCLAAGLARVQQDGPNCPEPEPGNRIAAAYCETAERRMRDKKARSSFYTSCLQADSVCRASRTAELRFHDGCNRCFCLPDRNAACTKAACPPKFLTPEEFADHCKRVRAGVVTRK